MQTVWVKAEQKVRDIEEFLKGELGNTDLAPIEMHILELLSTNRRMKASAIASETGRAATSYTPILDKLEIKGLIERFKHPSDRRAIEVGLTDKGASLVGRVTEALEKAEKQFGGKVK